MYQSIPFKDNPTSVPQKGAARTLDAAALGLDPLPWLTPAPLPEEEPTQLGAARAHLSEPATAAGAPKATPGGPSSVLQQIFERLLLEGREPLLT